MTVGAYSILTPQSPYIIFGHKVYGTSASTGAYNRPHFHIIYPGKSYMDYCFKPNGTSTPTPPTNKKFEWIVRARHRGHR